MVVVARAERYTIERRPDGVVLRMRQGANGVRLALVAGGVLLASWWYGPFGPHPAATFGGPAGQPTSFYWIWSGFFAFVLLLSLLAPFYREDLAITDREILAVTSFCGWKRTRRVPRGEALGLWTETVGGDDAVFPFRLHLLDAGGSVSGLHLELQRRPSVERIVEGLRSVWTVEVWPRPRSNR